MMRRDSSRRGGSTTGNVFLVGSCVVLLLALLHPRVTERAFERRVSEVAGRVESLRSAADSVRRATGTWPPTSWLAQVAATAPDASRTGPEVDGDGVRVEWRRIESGALDLPAAEEITAIPEDGSEITDERSLPRPEFFHRGLISVHTADTTLLGALLERFGARSSLVYDDVWMLVLPRVRLPPTS